MILFKTEKNRKPLIPLFQITRCFARPGLMEREVLGAADFMVSWPCDVYKKSWKREHKKIERRFTDETQKKDTLLAQLNCLREEVWDHLLEAMRFRSRCFARPGLMEREVLGAADFMVSWQHKKKIPSLHS
jgi:hypothetical protein